LWDVLRRRKGGDHTLAALRSIRAVRPDGAPIYVIMDNLSANTTPAVHAWAEKSKVQLCLTPTYYSWANPIEAIRTGELCGHRTNRRTSAMTRMP
jgi:DDE superfamily endonuclease